MGQKRATGTDHPADSVAERLIDFGDRVIKMATRLPMTIPSRHIAKQVRRSCTAPAALYAEARSAESQPDYRHKLKVALKELDETQVWLKMVVRAERASTAKMEGLLGENRQLCRMLHASIKTSEKRPSSGP